MFTYAVRILDLQHQYGGTAWRTYDENFRRVRAHCPTMPWHTVNWDMAMSSLHIPSTSTQHQTHKTAATPLAGQVAGGRRPTPKGHCFRFDQRGSCSHSDCRFKHTCTICGKGHSRQKCRDQHKAKPTTDARKTPGPKKTVGRVQQV